MDLLSQVKHSYMIDYIHSQVTSHIFSVSLIYLYRSQARTVVAVSELDTHLTQSSSL